MRVRPYVWSRVTPPELECGPEGIELSPEQIVALFEHYDVGIVHCRGETVGKGKNKVQLEKIPVLHLDAKFGGFRQR